MIKSINCGFGLAMTGNNSSTYVSRSYNSNAQHLVGSMIYDLDTQCIKVYDGTLWQAISMNHPTIELDSDTKALLSWARKKRSEEMERDLLAQSNPTLKDLIRQIEEKEEQVLSVLTLLKEETKVGTS